ncbi:hypothetical protein ACH5A3_32380 [Streptomyces echinatus]|uniref:hypothetical protein n=1 Tax=Streptomyces echinatus TaxID=67293 RepID=UPI0037AB5D4F
MASTFIRAAGHRRPGPSHGSTPLASFLQRLRLTGDGLGRIATRDYVYLSGWTGTPFTELHERLAKDPEWRTHVLNCSHNVVRDALDDFQRILLLDE